MIPASIDGETLEKLESPVVLARFILECSVWRTKSEVNDVICKVDESDSEE
jgi:hypothetical protein